jgi:fucose 4-O-acetylase-like acetyltransferase
MASLVAQDSLQPIARQHAMPGIAGRDVGVDTMRGIAILMVIGIHSLRQPPGAWETAIDAMFRPCVPIFLFASGYLTALSGKVPLWKRLKAAIIPYAIAFAAAYLYMALHNPAMDHRAVTTLARLGLGFVFVYYYVFVYVGCTIGLWLVFSAARSGEPYERPLIALLMIAIVFGLIAGSYLDPLLLRLGLTDSQIEEGRMRDIPFWFSFAALGALAGQFRLRSSLRGMRTLLLGATALGYVIYTSVRLFRVGDAADYDSIAFFGYAALLCGLLFAIGAELPAVASLGSGSYFIYLWHIFFVMLLRDHAPLQRLPSTAASAITFAIAAAGSIIGLVVVRELVPPRIHRWLGA